jgi:hypothetical protein
VIRKSRARNVGVAATVILLGGVFAWLAWRTGPMISAGIADDSSVPRAAKLVVPMRATPSESPPTRTPAPPQSLSHPDEPSRASAELPSGAFATFRFEGGEPAAGFSVRRADVPPSTYGRELRQEIPSWDHHLDSNGRLELTNASVFGQVVAVRLSNAAMELLPFDPASERIYSLTPVVDQEFDLEGGPYEENTTFDLALGTPETLRYSGGDFQNHPIDEPFADTYCAVANSLEAPCVVACARLKLSTATRTIRRTLPIGRYSIGAIAAPIGWWMDWKDVEVDGKPISLTPQAVPVARVTLRRDDQGEVIAPLHVEFCIHTIGRGAESSGELRLPSAVRGDQLSVSLRVRYPDESQDRYALRLYWPDGTSTMTTEGRWQDLLTPIDLTAR